MNETYRPVVVFQTSERCNYRCVMCSWSNKESAKAYLANRECMSDALFARTLEEVADFASAVSLTGFGEFLADPEVAGKMKLMGNFLRRNSNIGFSQVTNGSLLDGCSLSFLENVSRVDITISIDTTNHIEYAYIRRPGFLSGVMENIENLRHGLQEIGVKHINISLGVVLMKSNVFSLLDVVRFAHKIGAAVFCDHMEFAGVQGMSKQSLFHYPKLANMILAKAMTLADKLSVPFNRPPDFFVGDSVPESMGAAFECPQLEKDGPLIINANGDVRPCCGAKLVVGNVFEKKLSNILEGQEVRRLKESIKNGTPHAPCAECRFLQRKSEHLYDSKIYGWDIPYESRSMQCDLDFKEQGFFDWLDELPDRYLINHVKDHLHVRAQSVLKTEYFDDSEEKLSKCAQANRVLLKLHQLGARIIVYGAGNELNWLFRFTTLSNCDIALLVDGDVSKQGQSFLGYVISSPAMISDVTAKVVLVTASRHFDEIRSHVMSVSDDLLVVDAFGDVGLCSV
jgi:radical SAM protein with 4Fe4S-binding SPASM domain